MKRVTYLLAVLFTATVAAAQTSLPAKVKVFCPDYILSPNGSENWQEETINKIKRGHFGKSTNTIWTVFSDRANNTTYSSPGKSTKFSTLDLAEKVYVADIKNGFALVFSDVYKQSSIDGTINSSAVSKGWIPIDNLLMWNQCPKNENQIYRKGVVVFSVNKNSNIEDRNLNYLSAPAQNALHTNNRSNDLDFLYCMKKIEVGEQNYYLLSKEHIISTTKGDIAKGILFGWMSATNLTEWNYRLVIEPTFAPNAVNWYKNRRITPTIFPEDNNGQSSAFNFIKTGNINNPLWTYTDFNTERMRRNRMRNPILEQSGDLYRVATLSSVGGNGSLNENELAEIMQQITDLNEALDQINVIFVIDATSSMKKYYPAVAKSLEDVMEHQLTFNMKIGAVLYKDYPDPDCIQYQPVTANAKDVVGFINRAIPKLGSKDPDDWEAMLLGLETALDKDKMKYKSNESNFIVLIGDAGNRKTTPKGVDWKTVANGISKKMCDNNINFMAYQVSNVGTVAYTDFAIQIAYMQKEFTNKYQAQFGINVKYDLESNGWYRMRRTDRSKNLLPRYITYKFLSAGQSETGAGLQSVITDNIVGNDGFCREVEQMMDGLNKMRNEGLRVKGDINIEELIKYFMSLGMSRGQGEKMVKALIEKGNMFKFFGWTPLKIKDSPYNLWEYVLLISDKELSQMCQVFSQINSVSANNKKAFQYALLAIGQAMIGNFNGENTNVDEMFRQILGVPVQMKFCGDFNIADIPYMDDEIVNGYIETYRKKLTEIVKIKNNPSASCTFKTNGNTYFWLKLSEMPGVCM